MPDTQRAAESFADWEAYGSAVVFAVAARLCVTLVDVLELVAALASSVDDHRHVRRTEERSAVMVWTFGAVCRSVPPQA